MAVRKKSASSPESKQAAPLGGGSRAEASGEGRSARQRGGRKSGYHHGDLRRALLDAALVQVREEGVATLSLREVARRAGVSQAAPYRHFANREALVASVAEEGFRLLHDAMVSASEAVVDRPAERLRQTGIAYVRFAVAHPAHFRVMFGTASSCEHPGLEEASAGAFGVLLGSIEAGLAAGAFREGPPMDHALAAWSIVHGLASLLVEGRLPPALGSVDALAELVTQRLFEGLAQPIAQPPDTGPASGRSVRPGMKGAAPRQKTRR